MALGQEAVLQQGSQGLLVRRLQEALAGAGFSPGAIDGIFGPQTREALIRFQNAKGLTPDGIAGPATWAALRGQPMQPAPAPAPSAPAVSPVPPARAWYADPMTWLILFVGGTILLGSMRTR